MPYERPSNKFSTWLAFDEFLWPDGSFQFSKNIDVRRNPSRIQLAPRVSLTDYSTVKITAILWVDTTNIFTFSSAGRVYLNNVLAYTLTGAVTNKEILNACIFKSYMYIFTPSGVHRITIANAIAWAWWGITENYINYAVTAYVQPLDAGFTSAVLDFKNAAGVVTNFSLTDRDGNTVTGYALATISSGYTQVTWWPFANGPFTATYDFVPEVWSRIPVLNYYDSTLYVALKSIVMWYHPQLGATPDVGLLIEFENNQQIVWITAHDTQFSIYVQVDSQNSRKYLRSGKGTEPSAVVERSWIVINNVGASEEFDYVTTNDPRSEISSIYKTIWYQKSLVYEGKKANGNVLNGELHVLAMNQNLPIKKDMCFVAAEQWIYAAWFYYAGFPICTTREWQWATQIRPWCWVVHNSYLYVSLQNISNSTYYLAKIDLNYEPAITSTSHEASWELRQRVFKGNRVTETKTFAGIEVGYEFIGTQTVNANNWYIELYIRCNKRGNRLKIRTIDARSGTDINNMRCIIDVNEISAAAIALSETTSFLDWNVLDWKVILYSWSAWLCLPVVYEVNVLYDIVNVNHARW